ncbi:MULTISPECIES: type III glutamate--ammonia ligase [Cyanophyceae]|uniref:type III glutamate--ammonia ligase n=1 Tax=Cyanophyceae TaxID=3028117 RepID=UPI00168337E6|nr:MULTISPECIES: type III glutamate--ammonia ligase [Cyanophyceae]MBD1915487.1 type III glutamate--ammonia ligase [Phormidium sp. FACHB-77]MBD2031797.1 type III glutamate--ammonia ligase [Phormidium sp. FACHB-322]MBD2050547.1 type III glutamate--ammonia ligase [Leptolyngbya sp. FACHB-60]
MVSMLTQVQNLAERAKALGIKFFLVSYTDLLGGTRAKLVPATQMASVEKDGAFFCSFASNLGLGPEAAEIAAVPDPDSLIQLPWEPTVGWVACDVYYEGEPFPAAPRMMLNRVIDQAASLSYTLKTGVEAEFFLLRQTETGYELADPKDTAERPCYDQLNLMRQFDLISTVVTYMEDLGWGPYQCDHEDANGQFELNWTYSDAKTTCDRHVFFKYMVKTLAEQRGFVATFMPKPFSHITGNGGHVHNSLWQGDVNAFAEGADAGGLSPIGYNFLGGVLAHGKGLTALCAPTVNSYRRLGASTTTSGSTWSPRYISYGGNNRSHLIRIPDKGRFECRMIDGAVNLYLATAGILAAGLEGIQQQLDPGQRIDENLFARGDEFTNLQTLPHNLYEAMVALKQDPLLMETMGELGAKTFLEMKAKEWNAFNAQITTWEMDQYVNV